LLVEGLGVAPLPEHMTPLLRTRLKGLGVRAGRYALFVPALLKPRALQLRALLWSVRHGVALPTLPAPGLVSLAPPADWTDDFAAAMGWVATGPVLLRLDIAERVAAELAWAGRNRPVPIPGDLASRLSVPGKLLPAVLRGLGLRLYPTVALPLEQYGPPAPPMVAAARRRPDAANAPPPSAVPPRRDSPFAALAALRRP